MAARGRGRGRGGRGFGSPFEHRFVKHEPYALFPVQSQGPDIERYSDKIKLKGPAKREALESYLKLFPSNFPTELIQGSRKTTREKKKLRWDVDSDEKLFEKLERLEENVKEDEKGDKDKKGESDEEEEEQPEEVEEESSEEDDYNQNIEFDDDEDDLNMEEEEFEDAYE
ncbi:uncharacterized protein LOC144706486 isoform X3 [Wolffia australiana]